jgi:hypothetical protein
MAIAVVSAIIALVSAVLAESLLHAASTAIAETAMIPVHFILFSWPHRGLTMYFGGSGSLPTL